MNNLPSLAPNCLLRMRLAPPKALAHALFLTGLLLGLFLLLPADASSPEAAEQLWRNQESDPVNLCTPTEEPPPDEPEIHGPYKLYLPFVAKPSFVITGGSLKLNTDNRHRGLTLFGKAAKLDVGDVQFSYPYKPAKMRVYYSDGPCYEAIYTDSNHLVPLVVEGDAPTPIVVGANHVEVEFELGVTHGLTTLRMPFTFFYIPNGDFRDPQPDKPDNYWQLSSIGPEPPEPPTVQSGKLLLGNETSPCNPTPLGAAIAALEIEIPPHSDYILHIHGVVYTQDQNPSNTATYDAFEIAINGHLIERYSNRHPPIRCTNPITRQIEVKKEISLNNFAGQIVLSLENHLRYDNYFNTYTEIDMVWIDK